MTPDDDVLSAPLSVLGLTLRASNALLNNGFSTVQEVMAKTDVELARLPLIGPSRHVTAAAGGSAHSELGQALRSRAPRRGRRASCPQ